MFFEEQDFSACVTDVISFNERKKAVVPTAARSFYALSFRHTADTYFKTDNEVVEVSSHSIALVPANIQYTRVAQNESMTVIHFTPSRELGNKIKVFYPDNYIEYEKCFYKLLKVWKEKMLHIK